MNWKLWFLQLSGWPVFLTVVVLVFLFMMGLSVVLTRLSNRSAVQSAVVSGIVLIVLALGILGLIVVLNR